MLARSLKRRPSSRAITPGPRLPWLALAASLLGSCSYGGEDDPGLAGRSVDDSFRLVATDPAAGRTDVPPGWYVELRFNGPPDPDTAIPANVRVFAGLIETTGEIAVDLLDQRVRFVPSSPLRPRLRHQVYVHESVGGLNGVSLDDTVVFNFTTNNDETTPPPSPSPGVSGSRVQSEVFTPRCSSCHGPSSPPARVDLSTLAGTIDSLRQVPAGYGSRLRVAPGDHARSYLMMKLLGVGGFVGFRMPATGARLTRSELRLLASWIDAGARP